MKGKEKSSRFQKQALVVEEIPNNREEKLGYFLRKVQDRIADLLDAQSLKISDKKIPFASPPKDQSKELNLRLRLLQESKQKVQSQLREVSQQERLLKSQQRHHILHGDPKQRSLSPLQIKPKSELSEKDIQLLKRLKKQQREFERSLENKTKEYEKRMQEMKRQEQQLIQKQKKEQIESRKKDIAQKLQALAKRRAEKEKQYEQQRLRIVELKAKKKLFEQLDQKQKQADKAQFQAKVAAMQQRLKQRQIDLQSIREHQQKYRQMKAEQQAERLRRKEERDDLSKQSRLNVDKSKFYTLVVSEAKKKKEDQINKMKQKIELVEAAREYAENVKREHAPRVKTKSSQEEKPKDQEKKEGLTFQETRDVGNSYFQFMRKLPKRKNKGHESALESESRIKGTLNPLRTLSTKYKDYLSEQRITRTNNDKMSLTRNSRIRDRGIMKEVQQACKLAEDKKNKQGLEQLQYVASKLQTQRGGEDRNMLDKISAKLKILETLANR